jgi:hypothetical protein
LLENLFWKNSIINQARSNIISLNNQNFGIKLMFIQLKCVGDSINKLDNLDNCKTTHIFKNLQIQNNFQTCHINEKR